MTAKVIEKLNELRLLLISNDFEQFETENISDKTARVDQTVYYLNDMITVWNGGTLE